MLLIGGLQRLSLIDYPGRVAAVVFTQGCNFRCPFCHNRELVIPQEFKTLIPEEEVISFLVSRQDKLQGVVITGGEPTIQPDLIPFIRKVKALGLAVKLDTNASHPAILADLIREKLVDFFAVDVKASPDRYELLSGVKVNMENIRKGIDLVLHSGVDHLFRTTVVKPLFSPQEMSRIAELINGARKYRLQEFAVSAGVLDQGLLDQGQYTEQEFAEMKRQWEKGFET